VYLAFEFLKGQSLRAEMAGRPLNVRRAVETAIQISDALATAHAAGFVHGGLSPDSIAMTARGHAKIPAFELAAHSGFENAGGEIKLHDYDSPEEARGQTPDDRSDIYSVGAILFEMLTARRPMHRGAAAPSATNVHVIKELDDVVLKALAPNPDSRYQSVATFASELRAIVALIDAKGGTDDEEDVLDSGGSGVGRILLVAAVILVLAAIGWFVLRP
jgi:serine/threonine-protein kinase